MRSRDRSPYGSCMRARFDTDGYEVVLLDDARQFLTVAGDHLAENPVLNTVVTSVAHATISADEAGVPSDPRHWWLVVRDAAGRVVGAGMRTAPWDPCPPYLLDLPPSAAQGLAAFLHGHGAEIRAVNGCRPAAEAFASETARLSGRRVHVAVHTRLHVLRRLTPPAPVPGRLAPVDATEVDLLQAWLAAFHGDADEQAGRPRGSTPDAVGDRAALLIRIAAGEFWWWRDAEDRPVHLTGVRPPAYGVARVGPVYTPPEQRGRGWASAAVAQVSQRLLVDGIVPCLFTDQANPTSNRIYAALGYEPVADLLHLLID